MAIVAFANFVETVSNSFLQPIFIQFLTLGFQILPLFLTFWTNNDRQRDENWLNNPGINETYDFIVVGAGCAGALVANRLSRYHNVLLIEEGGEPNPIQFVPFFAQSLLNYPELDYGFRTVPQKYNDGLVNKAVSLNVGRGLGGSANLNLLVFLRGHVKDFDNWAEITGDPSWSWEGVLPYFKRFEDYEIPGDYEYHGYDGELRIETPDYIGTAREFVDAAGELGYPNVDLNAPFSEGFDVIRYPLRNGVRQATFKAFIEPVRTRSTLTIRKFSQVNKILLKSGNVAYGVEYDRHGRTYVAYASKEVIVTAGSIGTAKLLQLSGIGPRDHLESWNIPVLANLPVGENLKDHPTTLLTMFFLREPRSIHLSRDITYTEFLKWSTVGQGRLTSSTLEATGFISSSFAKARGEGDWPDIQLMLTCAAVTSDTIPTLAHSFNLKLDSAMKYFTPGANRDSCLVGVVAARPRSKGYVKLGGSSPYDTPVIQPNYFADEVDLKVVVEGIKTAMVLMENTTSYGWKLGAQFTDTVLPGCEGIPFRSDDYWACFVKHWTISTYHPSGTASMGSVVDTKLRVYGIKNLRICDQSIVPEHMSTNTMASTLMIAEKGSEMILQEWKHAALAKEL